MTPQITLVGDGKTTVVTAQGPITLTVDDSPSTPTPTPPIQPPDPTPTPPSGGVPGGPGNWAFVQQDWIEIYKQA